MTALPQTLRPRAAEAGATLAVSPYVIAGLATVAAVALAALRVTALLPWEALVAAVAGWSATWSP